MEPKKIYEILEEAYFGDDIHEADELEQLPDMLKGIEVFVDVGGSLGQYTFHANKTLQNATIFVIEADPIRFEKLEKNCEKWAKESSNQIFPIFGAASNKAGTITFFSTESNVSGSLFELNERADHWVENTVPAILLDELLKDHFDKKIFIKMDIEGGEYRALCGARKVLENDCSLLAELHPWGDKELGVSPSHIVGWLKQYGFSPKPTSAHFLFLKNTSLFNKTLQSWYISAKLGLKHFVWPIVKGFKKP